jgi:hypothetical protein
MDSRVQARRLALSDWQQGRLRVSRRARRQPRRYAVTVTGREALRRAARPSRPSDTAGPDLFLLSGVSRVSVGGISADRQPIAVCRRKEISVAFRVHACAKHLEFFSPL